MISVGSAYPQPSPAAFTSAQTVPGAGPFAAGGRNNIDTHPPLPVGDTEKAGPQPSGKESGAPPNKGSTPPGNSAGNIALHNLTNLQEDGQHAPGSGSEDGGAHDALPAAGTATATADPDTLSTSEKAVVEDLKARDLEVHAHERAHAAAGGQYAGAMSFGYTTGPDGQRYATSGEVGIDMSPVAGDPEATIEKMQVIIEAALAPAKPSAQDRSVAQAAKALIIEAEAKRAELEAAQAQTETSAAGNIPSDPNNAFAPAAVNLVV